jgi:hypothetical protein
MQVRRSAFPRSGQGAEEGMRSGRECEQQRHDDQRRRYREHEGGQAPGLGGSGIRATDGGGLERSEDGASQCQHDRAPSSDTAHVGAKSLPAFQEGGLHQLMTEATEEQDDREHREGDENHGLEARHAVGKDLTL